VKVGGRTLLSSPSRAAPSFSNPQILRKTRKRRHAGSIASDEASGAPDFSINVRFPVHHEDHGIAMELRAEGNPSSTAEGTRRRSASVKFQWRRVEQQEWRFVSDTSLHTNPKCQRGERGYEVRVDC
jgi:hypothetical protein